MTRLPWKVGLLPAMLMVISASAPAKPRPVATVAPDAYCHASVRDAAIAGLRVATAKSRKVEYGGAVFERNADCFVHTTPVTSNHPSQLEYALEIGDGHLQLVGIYHTHTPGLFAGVFSKADVSTQRRLGVPSYVGTSSAGGRITVIMLGSTAQATTLRSEDRPTSQDFCWAHAQPASASPLQRDSLRPSSRSARSTCWPAS
jgi:proteasome lid subunit RPN8/RPN11